MTLTIDPASEETEAEEVALWCEASRRSLQELWDNDEDAIYDTFDTEQEQ